MKISPNTLQAYLTEIFQAQEIPSYVAERVAESLVLADLKGHASHGSIRVIDYTDWLKKGWFNPNGELKIIKDASPILSLA